LRTLVLDRYAAEPLQISARRLRWWKPALVWPDDPI